MKPEYEMTPIPPLPPRLERLRELAYNLSWTWNPPLAGLFRHLDGALWEATGRNPVLLLARLDPARLHAAAADEEFLSHLDQATRSLERDLAGDSSWFHRTHPTGGSALVAYFSAEFGVAECLPIFAGGLGVLSGDHLKSASHLGVPLVGVGLLYRQGYFRQQLTEGSWQHEAYEDHDFHTRPLILERRPEGAPLTFAIPFPGQPLTIQVWRAQVGRVPLFLLDTDLPSNQPGERRITGQLYGGDLEMRIRQEVVLGIGGCHALEALGLEPVVYHMNEGHSAFLALERVRRLMERHGLSFAEARQTAASGQVFTAHTPVPAGHDRFPPDLVERYIGPYASALGLSRGELLALGRWDPGNQAEPFDMTVLALRLSAHRNGVSKLHGQTSRRIWQALWPGAPEEKVPIGHVTNGIHLRTWASPEIARLFERYLGPRWREESENPGVWRQVVRIPDQELWRTHENRREELVRLVRRRLRAQRERRGALRSVIDASDAVLDPAALTIGFARRFATYKRAMLVFRDPERLARLLGDPARPVQVIIAGKAHPRDEAGKELIRQVLGFAREERFRLRLVFLEDYDILIARHLVQGADVWLNTPRRPLEASGTSGMKAAANGVLNLSTLDGWWAEAWEASENTGGPGGWAIGRGESYDDPEEQDRVEAEALYALLEHEVVPTFYDRGADGLPSHWIARMKATMAETCPFFHSDRMVREYTDRFYIPAAGHFQRLLTSAAAGARADQSEATATVDLAPRVRPLAGPDAVAR